MIFLRSVLALAITAMVASSAISQPQKLRPKAILEARDDSDSGAGSLEASLDYNVDASYFTQLQNLNSWQTSNASVPSPPPSSSSSSVSNNGAPVTISITQTGRPISEDEILIGLIATLALLYSKQLAPEEHMPDGGVRITFNAGLRHTISLEPVRGHRVTWAALADAIKQTGNVVRVKRVATEFIFVASYYDAPPFLRGIVANPSEADQDQPATSRRL